jgi:hypothetical protein
MQEAAGQGPVVRQVEFLDLQYVVFKVSYPLRSLV